MNDFFIKKYSLIRDKGLFLQKIKYYSAQRFLLRILANIFVPAWFVLTNLTFSKKLKAHKKDRKIIVSLTTFPSRINKIWIVVECMLRQTYPPDRIILWLSKKQFHGLSSLPDNLLKLQRRGLEINFCDEDLRSHKKYFYTLKNYSNDVLITVDDDFIYPSSLIEELMKLHLENPQAICCHRALHITMKEKKILPYNDWEYIYNQYGPAFDIFFTSGGGTLFPPFFLHKEVLNDEVFMKFCKYADDIWLNLMSQMNNIKTVKSAYSHGVSIPLYIPGNTTLSSINVDDGLNDIQLNDVRSFYMKNKGIDPLKNLYIN